MNRNKITSKQPIQKLCMQVIKLRSLFLFGYIVTIILYDAFNLIVPESIIERWIAVGIVVLATFIIWLAAREKVQHTSYYRSLIGLQIALDIGFAAFNVYAQRGMASKAVILFIIPIIISALLMRRRAIVVTTALSVVFYVIAVLQYFFNNPSEGYKVELYGEMVFYSFVLCIVAFLTYLVMTHAHSLNKLNR